MTAQFESAVNLNFEPSANEAVTLSPAKMLRDCEGGRTLHLLVCIVTAHEVGQQPTSHCSYSHSLTELAGSAQQAFLLAFRTPPRRRELGLRTGRLLLHLLPYLLDCFASMAGGDNSQPLAVTIFLLALSASARLARPARSASEVRTQGLKGAGGLHYELKGNGEN